MSDEIKVIFKNNTWDLVHRPEGSSVIGRWFILRNKYTSDGIAEKKKARIVAKSYSQQYGNNFHETYAPVARLSSLRTVIVLAAHQKMILQQFDITAAYLNGRFDETVLMEPPEWLEETLKFIVEKRKSEGRWID